MPTAHDGGMQWLRNQWRWLAEAALIAVQVWLVLDWSLPDGDLAALNFGTAEYVAVVVFVSICAVAVMWSPIYSTFPATKFGTYHVRFVEARDVVRRARQEEPNLPLLYETVAEVSYILKEFDIKTPDLELNQSTNRTQWHAFLTRLVLLAEKNQLRKARKMAEEYRKRLDQND